MLKRLAATFVLLAFVGPVWAGGLVCAEGGYCHGMARMACCAMAKSPAGSRAAMLCCWTVCSKSTDETPAAIPEAAAQSQDFSQAVASISFDPADRLFGALLAVSMRSADSSLLYQDPPDLYLQHSNFLI